MDIKTISSAVKQIAAERGIEPEKVLEAIETALASAYKKEYRKRSEVVRAKFDSKKGDVKFWLIKTVVDPDEVRIPEESEKEYPEGDDRGARGDVSKKEEEDEEGKQPRYNPERDIFIEEAKGIKSDAELGEELLFELEAQEDFGRIAAQTAKQVILQNVREAERVSIREEFADKEGEIVSGVVQRYERGHVYVDLDRAMGIMFQNESVPGEHYRTGQRMRFFVLAVQEEERRKPGIILSRAHPEFVKKLFELEVPEIMEEVVEIKEITREPGSRTKIAVVSYQEGIDPVGSVVGQRGSRIMAVINELGNEKIDVVEWAEEPDEYIESALSPAKVKLVEIHPRREAVVLVSEDQLSLAIGRGGQNVRLAAKLTGWKIDVRSQSDPDAVQEGGIADATKEVSDDTVVPEKVEEVELEKNETADSSDDTVNDNPPADGQPQEDVEEKDSSEKSEGEE